MANPTTNYGWPMPTSTDLVTDLPADFALFGQPVDTSLKALNPETTLGDIAYRSSTSNTNTRLGIGSAGQVLTVASGIPSWVAPASGLTLITRATFTSVATTTTTFDSVFSSTYKTYLIVLEKFFAATAANDPYMQLRYAGPNTYAAALYQSSTATIPCGTATQTITGYANATQWVLALSSASSAENFGGEYWLYGVGTSSINAQMNGSGSSGYEGSNVLAYLASTAQTYTGFILSSSSSNITGTVAVYGLATA